MSPISGSKHPELQSRAWNPRWAKGHDGPFRKRLDEHARYEMQGEGFELSGRTCRIRMFHAAAAGTIWTRRLPCNHDQALIPIKDADFDRGVNFTARPCRSFRTSL